MCFRTALAQSVLIGIFSATSAFASSDLTINAMHSDPTAKKAFDTVVEKFKQQHKEISVKVNVIDHESFKIQIRTWLPNNPPDVVTWFAGNRAKFFVDKNLIEPIDEIWKLTEAQFSDGAKKSVTFNGHAYLMPTNYYHWGFFYRKDIFEKSGIKTPPQNWQEFTADVEKLKAQKLIPIAIGTKQAWPAAAWFDFFNLRVNGFDFHIKLLHGEESYLSPQVKKSMGYWADLIKSGAFPENAPALTWQEASALLWQGKSAMYLMGNFMSTEIPQKMQGKIGFFGFPAIVPGVPLAQVAPTDVYFIPARAQHKDNAKTFLAYLATAETQSLYNDISGLLPPNKLAKINLKNEFLKAGKELLDSAAGTSQFFDRDADPEVAKVGMDGFVEFMHAPDKLDSILIKIENARKRTQK